jgi:hypothetical protein
MNTITKIIISIAIGIGFLIIMLTEGSYIAYIPHK